MTRFVEHPQYFEPARFTEVRDQFVARAIQHPWVKGIWQFGGEQPVPAYSDVDLLISVDGSETRPIASLSPFSGPANIGENRIFRHWPIIVDDQSLAGLCYYVDPTLVSFRQLAGPPSRLRVLGESERAAVHLAQALDCLPRTFCLLVRLLNFPEVPVVPAFRQLNHFAIQCRLLCALDLLGGLPKHGASQLAHDVARLKQRLWSDTWEELGGELSRLMRRAFELYFDLVGPLDAAQLRLGFENPLESLEGPSALITDVGGYVVRDAQDIMRRLRSMPPEHFHRGDGVVGRLPVAPVTQGFLAQMLLYAVDSPGEEFLDFLVSRWIGDEASLSHHVNLLAASSEREDDVYGRVVRRRTEVAHRHMEFLAWNNSVRGLEPAFTGMLWTFRRMTLLTRKKGQPHSPTWLRGRLQAIRAASSGWDL